MKNKQLIALIKKHNGKVLKFRQLPREAKYAMAYYMSVDGEAWNISDKVETVSYKNYNKNNCLELVSLAIKDYIGFYTRRYGDEKFGYVNIPTSEFLDLFGSLRNIYDNRIIRQHREEIWPVILDFNAWDEKNHPNDITIIQDGWRRFYDYVAMKIKMIPCLYYIE
jgi:hypothetical protein